MTTTTGTITGPGHWVSIDHYPANDYRTEPISLAVCLDCRWHSEPDSPAAAEAAAERHSEDTA